MSTVGHCGNLYTRLGVVGQHVSWIALLAILRLIIVLTVGYKGCAYSHTILSWEIKLGLAEWTRGGICINFTVGYGSWNCNTFLSCGVQKEICVANHTSTQDIVSLTISGGVNDTRFVIGCGVGLKNVRVCVVTK